MTIAVNRNLNNCENSPKKSSFRICIPAVHIISFRNSSESVPIASQSQEQLARLQNRKNSLESVVDNQTIFNAEKILKSRRRNGETQYLVKWVGCP